MNNDLISREALKKELNSRVFQDDYATTLLLSSFNDIIDNAPTVDTYTEEDMCDTTSNGFDIGYDFAKAKYERPQGEWIPVSERLPNRNGCYNVTRIIEGTAISDVCYFDGQNTWHRDTGVNHGRPYLNDIIAWQPLPEPYKEEGEEERA